MPDRLLCLLSILRRRMLSRRSRLQFYFMPSICIYNSFVEWGHCRRPTYRSGYYDGKCDLCKSVAGLCKQSGRWLLSEWMGLWHCQLQFYWRDQYGGLWERKSDFWKCWIACRDLLDLCVRVFACCSNDLLATFKC